MLFGGGESKKESAPVKDLKRKFTDPNLEMVDIDKMPDLTLIVGSPGSPGGQKGSNVNRGSFRNACGAFATMLNGNWAVSGMSEIRFPDDSPFAFQVILRIAHWQFDGLLSIISQAELVELAKLSDKYDLRRLWCVAIDMKKWLEHFRGSGMACPAHTDLQDFILITRIFGYVADYEYLLNCLAMRRVLRKACTTTRRAMQRECASEQTSLQASMVENARNIMLREILQTCKTSLATTLMLDKGSKRQKIMCPLNQVGIIMKGLQATELYPLPGTEFAMHRSVKAYRMSLKDLGKSYVGHMPDGCKTGSVYRSRQYVNVPACYTDFGIASNVKEILKRHAHKDVWTQWETVKVV